MLPLITLALLALAVLVPRPWIALAGVVPAGPMSLLDTVLLLLPPANVLVLNSTVPVAAVVAPVAEPRIVALVTVLLVAPSMKRIVLVPAVPDAVVFDSEHGTGAGEARLHLVGDEDRAGIGAPVLQRAQESRCGNDESTLTLDRLDHHGGHVFGTDLLVDQGNVAVVMGPEPPKLLGRGIERPGDGVVVHFHVVDTLGLERIRQPLEIGGADLRRDQEFDGVSNAVDGKEDHDGNRE